MHSQIYELLDEWAQRLARRVGLFTAASTVTITGGTATVAAPARHLSTVHVAYDSDGAGDFQVLDPATPAELEALDTAWETAAGAPSHWTQGNEGLETLRVYKTPASNTNAKVVHHEHLATITSAAASITAPEVLRQYFFYAVLGEARRQESDEGMPEVAAYCAERVTLLEQVFQSYWGRAQ